MVIILIRQRQQVLDIAQVIWFRAFVVCRRVRRDYCAVRLTMSKQAGRQVGGEKGKGRTNIHNNMARTKQNTTIHNRRAFVSELLIVEPR